MIRPVSMVTLIVLGLAVPASAEVFECDGRWTNKPCTGEVTKSIEESGSTAPVDPAIQAIREKTSLLHNLRMSTIRAKDQYDLRIDIADVEDFCLKKPTTPQACRDKIAARQLELDRRLSSASAVAARERSIELQEEANRLQREQNEIEANRPNITVIEEERPIIVVPRDHHHQSGAGASIHVGGSSTGGSISIDATTGTHGTVSGPTVIVVPDDRDRPRHDKGVVLYDRHGNAKKIEGVKPGPFTPKKAQHDRDQYGKCR